MDHTIAIKTKYKEDAGHLNMAAYKTVKNGNNFFINLLVFAAKTLADIAINIFRLIKIISIPFSILIGIFQKLNLNWYFKIIFKSIS